MQASGNGSCVTDLLSGHKVFPCCRLINTDEHTVQAAVFTIFVLSF